MSRLMVKSPHEALHQIFRHDNILITAALRCLEGVDVKDTTFLKELPGDVTALPQEGRVDSVLHTLANGQPCILSVEAQGEPDPDKETQWPYYVAYLYAKYKKPVALLVVTNKKKTAEWARQLFSCQMPGFPFPTLTCRAIVFGPDSVPLPTDLEQIRENVFFAAFAAIVHGRSRKVADILEPLEKALSELDIPTAKLIYEITAAGLVHDTPKEKWRRLLAAQNYRFESEITSELVDKGRAEGHTEVILAMLEANGVSLSEVGRQRIASCTDKAQLTEWALRAANATSEEELFA